MNQHKEMSAQRCACARCSACLLNGDLHGRCVLLRRVMRRQRTPRLRRCVLATWRGASVSQTATLPAGRMRRFGPTCKATRSAYPCCRCAGQHDAPRAVTSPMHGCRGSCAFCAVCEEHSLDLSAQLSWQACFLAIRPSFTTTPAWFHTLFATEQAFAS